MADQNMRGLDALEPKKNLLLNQLPKADYKRIASRLERTTLNLGELIYEMGKERNHIYFPIQGIVSIIEILKDGASSELALVGSEGMLGITALLGGKSDPTRAVVQSAGIAYYLPAKVLLEVIRTSTRAMELFLLYAQVRYTHIAQTAVCNRHHNLQQQLCRWLLLSLDRSESNEIPMTQELIAGMLGVRREAITRAAGELQKKGVIDYRRGCITVVDRAGLEELCCECYEDCKRESDRLYALQKALG